MGRIFISHSSSNNDEAVKLRDWLRANGWDDVFLDLHPKDGIKAGERWQDALRLAAHRCEVILALISPQWLKSDWCRAELQTAKLLGKRIFPLLLGDVDIGALAASVGADHQAVDLREPHCWERLKEGLKRAGLDPENFEFADNRRPYPGFEPLGENDAAIFFGREAQIVRGLDRLRTMRDGGVERMLVILGASGAGKSSFLRAGLWPRLKRDDRNFLPLPVIRPERGVLAGKFGLFAALETMLSAPQIAARLAGRDVPRARRAIADAIDRDPLALAGLFEVLRDSGDAQAGPDFIGAPTIVVCIDQAEELFNDDGRAEAERFMDLIAKNAAKRVIIVLGIRSDSFPRLQQETRLKSLPIEPFDLRPIPEGALQMVIEGPAKVCKPPLKLEHALVQALLEDAEGQDALPVLAFTLGRLFQEYGAEGSLTLAHYDKLGGIKGAINAAATEALNEGKRRGVVPPDQGALEALLRAAFIPHLARVNEAGEFARRIALRVEIPAPSLPLVDLLADARLLIKDTRSARPGEAIGTEVIEVAHEALLREWPMLRRWLEEDREFLAGKQQLAQDLAAWEAAPAQQKSAALLSGLRLTRAKDWLISRPAQLSDPERKFIQASAARQDLFRRRVLAGGVAVGLVLAVSTAIAAWQWWSAEAALSRADRNYAAALRGGAGTADVVRNLLSADSITSAVAELLLDPSRKTVTDLENEKESDDIIEVQWQLLDTLTSAYLTVPGQGDQSFQMATKMRALAEKLSSSTPAHRNTVLLNSDIKIGDALDAKGDFDGALRWYGQADGLMETLAKSDLENPDLQWTSGYIHEKKGDDLCAKGDCAAGIGEYRKFLEIVQRLSQRTDPRPQWIRSWALAEERMGDGLRDEGDLTSALDHFREYQRAAQALLKMEPAASPNYTWRMDLWISYERLGEIFLSLKMYGEAFDNFETYRQGTEEVAVRNPEQGQWQRFLANGYIELGDTLLAQDKVEDALPDYVKAEKIYEKLESKDNFRASWQRNLALTHQRIGLAYQAKHDLNAALTEFNRCLSIQVNEDARDAQLGTPRLLHDDCQQHVNAIAGTTER